MTKVPDYIIRLVVEQEMLEKKANKLNAFTQTDTFEKLPIMERLLLLGQLNAMQAYNNFLYLRISLIPTVDGENDDITNIDHDPIYGSLSDPQPQGDD